MSHIVAEGVSGRELFRDAFDYAAFLHLLLTVKARCPFRLSAYCLLPDRLELVITTDQGNGSLIMHRLLLAYAKYHNRRYRLRGHVFARRFSQEVYFRFDKLLRLIREIHDLPVSEGHVDEADAWFWSGHGELRGLRERRLLDTALPLEGSRKRASQEMEAEIVWRLQDLTMPRKLPSERSGLGDWLPDG